MKAAFLIAASLIVGTAAIAQDATPPSAPPASTDMSTAAPSPASDPAAPPAPATDPAAAPAPMTNASPPADTAAPAPSADTSSYPPCSRTVHDKCVQSHEMARKAKPHR